jgi:large conductance mechanosensitive channel
MLREFREFVFRGNVVDLAVAVILAVAFGAVVTSFVENIITPLIAAIFGQPDFSSWSFTVNGSEIRYGAFINAVLSFLIIATVIFFVVVKPMNVALARIRTTPDPTTRPCPWCLSDVPLGARVCPFCTRDIEPLAG